jgi:hypothetical protein
MPQDTELFLTKMVGQGLTTGLQQAQFHRGKGRHNVLVVLVGWWMAKDRHLSKYLPIWHEQGCSTLSFIPNSRNFRFSSIAKQLLSNLNEYLKKEKEDKVTIIFHVFSNNGLMCLTTILGESKRNPEYGKIQAAVYGCIFDSCPGFLSLTAGFKAFAAANKNSLLNHVLFKTLCCILPLPFLFKFFRARHFPYYIAMVVLSYTLSWLRNKRYHGKFAGNLQLLKHCKSKLFLYSNADQLCTEDSIKSSLATVRAFDDSKDKNLRKGHQRHQVSEECFMGSGHVAHFLKHPVRYKNACMRVLNRVLLQQQDILTSSS